MSEDQDTQSVQEGAEKSSTSPEESTSQWSLMDKIKGMAVVLVILTVIFGFFYWSVAWDSYADMPLIGSSEGRMKNGIASVVIGYAGRKIAKQHNKPVTIDMEIDKFMWPNARVTGKATADSAESIVDLSFSTTTYTSKRNKEGLIRGNVDKADFDWKVKQDKAKKSKYKISRAGWNALVKMKLEDNKFSGRFEWKLDLLDHEIEGQYNPETHDVTIVIGSNKWFPTEKLTLMGTITPSG
jgi:hypothetical protein